MAAKNLTRSTPEGSRFNGSRQAGATNNVLTAGADLSGLSDASLGRLAAGAAGSVKGGGLQVQGSPLSLQVDVLREQTRRYGKLIGK